MKYTLKSAAEATGLAKSTIYRAVKAGKITASRNVDGEYEVDAAELHRVYPPVAQRAETQSTVQSDDSGGSASWWQRKLDDAEQELKTVRTELADTRTDLDDTRERLNEHRENARLLEHQKNEQERMLEQTQEQARRNSEQWKADLEKQQKAIQSARDAAEATEQKAADDIASIERRAVQERKRREALEKRGLFARILNRPVEG